MAASSGKGTSIFAYSSVRHHQGFEMKMCFGCDASFHDQSESRPRMRQANGQGTKSTWSADESSPNCKSGHRVSAERTRLKIVQRMLGPDCRLCSCHCLIWVNSGPRWRRMGLFLYDHAPAGCRDSGSVRVNVGANAVCLRFTIYTKNLVFSAKNTFIPSTECLARSHAVAIWQSTLLAAPGHRKRLAE